MNASRVIILGVAVAAAAGAGYVAKRMAAQPPQVVAVQQQPDAPQIQLEDVLVLNANLPMGAAIEDQLKWQPWPADAVSEGFITRSAEPDAIETLKGSIARDAIYTGEPLRRSKLIGQGQSFMSSILPSGKRAVATQIAADTSAGGFILPNDTVDVIMTRRATEQGAGAGEGFVTETILQNIRVLAIDQAIQEDEEGKRVRVGQTATLELTPQQAEIITVAQQMADRLTLSLRSITDTQDQDLAEADYLVNGQGKRGTIRLIKSGEFSEQGAR
ncbi:MAG TPA: Flp pilus assembly protein CpaB [Tianweitania sediminis]|jgi:pilus assembly protein CpaB|nr:Flp pilus assembly protein CpaB [Tianweitania sediminis]